MRISLVTLLLVLLVSLAASSSAAQPGTTVLLVDDDGIECPQADTASIQAAVDELEAVGGDGMIHVCPGVYREAVVVEAPLRLVGQPDAVAELDCFAEALPQLPETLFAILDVPSDPAEAGRPAITAAGDGIEVAGFVIRNRLTGIETSGSFSGYRIRHNLVTGARVAADISSGVDQNVPALSRFDHNCLRLNSWGFSGEHSANVRVDHNSTFRTAERAFEALGVSEDLLFDHNTSRLDNNTYLLSGTKRSRVVENVLDRARLGMEIGRLVANEDLEVSGNVFTIAAPFAPPTTAIAFNRTESGERNTRVAVTGNTITSHTTGIAVGGPPGITVGSLMDSQIAQNTITGSVGNGIRLRALNTGLVVRENVITGSGLAGIHAQCGLVAGLEACPTDNVFLANTILGSGQFDARDDTGVGALPLRNTWLANTCVTDLPAGQLCG